MQTLPNSVPYTLPSSGGTFSTYDVSMMYNGQYVGGDKTSLGSYYNFYTVTAGTGTTNISVQDVPDNVCPKEWTIPNHTQSQTAISKYSYSEFIKQWNVVYSGYLMGASTPTGIGSTYRYTTRSSCDKNTTYTIYNPSSSSIQSVCTGGKQVGRTVRCIAK